MSSSGRAHQISDFAQRIWTSKQQVIAQVPDHVITSLHPPSLCQATAPHPWKLTKPQIYIPVVVWTRYATNLNFLIPIKDFDFDLLGFIQKAEGASSHHFLWNGGMYFMMPLYIPILNFRGGPSSKHPEDMMCPKGGRGSPSSTWSELITLHTLGSRLCGSQISTLLSRSCMEVEGVSNIPLLISVLRPSTRQNLTVVLTRILRIVSWFCQYCVDKPDFQYASWKGPEKNPMYILALPAYGLIKNR